MRHLLASVALLLFFSPTAGWTQCESTQIERPAFAVQAAAHHGEWHAYHPLDPETPDERRLRKITGAAYLTAGVVAAAGAGAMVGASVWAFEDANLDGLGVLFVASAAGLTVASVRITSKGIRILRTPHATLQLNAAPVLAPGPRSSDLARSLPQPGVHVRLSF